MLFVLKSYNFRNYSCRGTLSSLCTILFEIGILLGYVFGTYTDYNLSPIVALIFPIVFFWSFIFVPSTPQFLLSIGRTDDAEKSLKFYRNHKRGDRNEMDVQVEFEKLKAIAKHNDDGARIRFADFC